MTAFAGEPASGWRGNATGLWPNSTAPLEWHRLAHGAMEGMRGQANRPTQADAGESPLVQKGLVREWLVLGPTKVRDSVENFDDDLLHGETKAAPDAGDEAAGLMWTKVAAKQDDPMDFGQAVLPWVELAKSGDFEKNCIAYAHTYLFSPRGGPARAVIEHCYGSKAWVNGREVYRAIESATNACELTGSKDPVYLETLAGANAETGNFDQAVRWQSRALEIFAQEKADSTDSIREAEMRLKLYRLGKPYRVETK